MNPKDVDISLNFKWHLNKAIENLTSSDLNQLDRYIYTAIHSAVSFQLGIVVAPV